jgi:hypothetical protein
MDFNNPSFILLPCNNNRTAWRPFGLPIVLVVPHYRNQVGGVIPNSSVSDLRIYIRDVPKEAKVAGPENTGLRFPDKELYGITIDLNTLNGLQVSPPDFDALDSDKNPTEDLVDGGFFRFTSASRIVDDIPYISHANYYDLSDIKLELEPLTPDRYEMVYETSFFERVLTSDELQEFLCIDANKRSIARFLLEINHPGDVMHEFYRLTPPPYLDNANKSKDTTIGLYRPFTDILQDVFDEQSLLERVNWVFDAPPETIPYMSAILGWDIPYFPESLDQLRKAVLRRTVELQSLSGSKQVVVRLFRLFGFEIIISNLWWSSDGKRFIRPGQSLPPPYGEEQIAIKRSCQIDLLLNDYDTIGFTSLGIPLLYRPQTISDVDNFVGLRDGGDVTIEAYRVLKQSTAHERLSQISTQLLDSPGDFGDVDGCFIDLNGFINSVAINELTNDQDLLGFSQINLGGKFGAVTKDVSIGRAPLSANTISLDRDKNLINLTINGYIDDESESIFVFAIYNKLQLIVPEAIKDLQSNRFDVQVITQEGTETLDPVVLDFVIEFLFRIKAFHSLLNLIKTRIELTETYLVTDWSVGGDVQMRFDLDAGRLQVPPAIIPDVPGIINDCTLLDPSSLGYKDADIRFRLDMLTNLADDFLAWLRLDGRPDQPIGGEKLAPPKQLPSETCQYTYHGQDKTTEDRTDLSDNVISPLPYSSKLIRGTLDNPKLSPIDNFNAGMFSTSGAESSSNSNSNAHSSFNREYTPNRPSSCQTPVDFLYKGRVSDELLYRPTIHNSESIILKPCFLSLGNGIYYTMPARSRIAMPGTQMPSSGSHTDKITFTGLAPTGNSPFPRDSTLSEYLRADYLSILGEKQNSQLGLLYRAYGVPTKSTLHYSNRLGLPQSDQKQNLALQKPELNIQQPTLHLPGCRFATLNRIKTDFVHPIWRAKPWDDQFNTYCGPRGICGNQFNSLDPMLITGTDGDDYLDYIDLPFSIPANGLDPDIPELGNHTGLTSPDGTIHKVYMTGDSPYVVEDSVCQPPSSIINVESPLFASHTPEPSGGFLDFSDGYPCSSGLFSYDQPDDWEGRAQLAEGLGLPTASETGIQLQFLLSSGILDTRIKNHRMDCGCTQIGQTIECSVDNYADLDGFYDWDADKIAVDLNAVLDEGIGACSTRLDGSIPSLIEIL